MSQVIQLHILNGPMRGRVLRLPKGAFTLGLGNVDLIAPLEGGLTQITLDVSDNGVSLLESTPCWVAGRLFQLGVLPLNKVIDLAGQAFILLAEGEVLSTTVIPERIGARGWQLSRQHKRWAKIISLTLLLLIVLIGFYLYQKEETIGDAMGRMGMQGWLAQQIQQPALTGLTFAWQPDGTLTVAGQCRSEKSIKPLMQMLRSQGVFYRMETVCQDQLLANVRYLLEQSGYKDVDVTAGAKVNQVKISGNIQANDRWQQVSGRLAEIKGLESWTVAGRQQDNSKMLLRIVRNAGLLGKISIERQDRRLILSGQLTQRQQALISRALTGLLTSQSLTLVLQNMPPMAVSEEMFPSPIVSVGGNKDKPYLILADGQRLEPGAVIRQGYEIVNIDPRLGVDLLNNEQLVHFPLTL